MCGILGVAMTLATRDRTEAALANLAWRGPDERRVVAAGAWWLGVARLAIRDRSAGQPMLCEQSGRVVAFNGVMTDATHEFRRFAGTARSHNDSELPLLRFAAEGEAGLHLGPGHHAAALVAPDTGLVWLMRDREGEKPLWVWQIAGRVVAFASTLASLAVLGARPRLGDEERARFLRYGWQPEPRAGDAGHELLEVAPGVHRIDAQGCMTRVPESSRAASPTDFHGSATDLRARVTSAVLRCADAEVPVALALSGGIDSACIAAALASSGRRLIAYQWCARGALEDERERAALIARHTGHELRMVDAGPEILVALPMLTAAVGLPLGDPSVLAVHSLARVVAADGHRVLLSGEGGDELFLGYDRQRAAAWLPRMRLRWLEHAVSGTSRWARLVRAFAAADPQAELLAAAPKGFLRGVLRQRGLADVAVREVAAAQGAAGLVRAHALDRHGYLRWDLLPKLDIALMAAGVEGRCPLLDPAVTTSAEALATPNRSQLKKRALVDAFRAQLPARVFTQRKLGFGIPLDRWLREHPFLPGVLADPKTSSREHIDGQGLRRMLDLHLCGRANFGRALYGIAALELWLRWCDELP